MKLALVVALSCLSVSCKKDARIRVTPDDAAPPPDAADSRYTGPYALVKPGARVYRDRDLQTPAFRTRTDHPTLFRLVSTDKKLSTIATLKSYDGGGCFEPALGTVGLNIELFVAREALVRVTTEKASDEVAPGITATLHPGAWAAGGLIRSQHVAIKRAPATAFSFDLEPIPEVLSFVRLHESNLPVKLRSLADTDFISPHSAASLGSKYSYRFDHGKREDGALTVRAGCVELRWAEDPGKGPPPKITGMLGVMHDDPVAAGATVLFADGSEAGTVAADTRVLPMAKPPLKDKLCGRFGGRKAPTPAGSSLADALDGKDDEPEDPYWVLCFDTPAD